MTRRAYWICLLLLATTTAWAQVPPEPPKVTVQKATVEPATARAGELVTLTVKAVVEDGWHVYGAKDTENEKTDLRITKGGKAVGERLMPGGKKHEQWGMVSYWVEGEFVISRKVRLPAEAQPGKLTLTGEIYYVPCDPKTCLNPETVPVSAALTIEAGQKRPDPANGAKQADARKGDGDAKKAETKKTDAKTADGDAKKAEAKKKRSLWKLITLAFFAGLLALVMPCTYPMIPITISFFTKQASDRGGFVLPLSLTYGFGIVSIFILIGVLIGKPIVVFATHPVTNLVIGFLFLVFALSLFGVYELRPPAFMMNFAGQASARGGYGGVFLMGATLVVTSFTCTAPFVGSLLAVGAASGEMLDVVIGMGVFGLTMAVPFVILSLVPGRIQSLPRSGEWMHAVKVCLGFLEVAAALKFFSNADLVWKWGILSRELFLMLWAGIFGATAAYLFGWIKMADEHYEGVGPLRMSFGLAVLMLAIYCGYGATGHKLDRIMLAIAPNYSGKPVAAATTGGAGRGPVIFKDDWDGAVARARKENKLLLVNFTGFT